MRKSSKLGIFRVGFACLCLIALATTAIHADDEMLADKSQLAGYGEEVARLVNQKDEIVSQLRNGMIVIVRRVPSPVVAVRGYAMTGGVYEGQWLGGGLSHLLEHLVAGGSNSRRTEEQNRNLLQAIGNDSNAYTTTDHTAFFVNTTPEHLDQAIDLVTGWMLTAEITEPEYRREYQVVQRELEMDKGNPDFVFAQLTNVNRYHVNSERVPVIGYQEVIQGLKVEDVRNYYHLAYQPNNIVFAVAGNLDPETMLK
ncbi:MAG: insulinase family protein, partial [Phycisphaerae bacterium]|nr:insulinase family protein [Phycisphaerae bacterium]